MPKTTDSSDTKSKSKAKTPSTKGVEKPKKQQKQQPKGDKVVPESKKLNKKQLGSLVESAPNSTIKELQQLLAGFKAENSASDAKRQAKKEANAGKQ